jgi:hypothetical protein
VRIGDVSNNLNCSQMAIQKTSWNGFEEQQLHH